MHVNLYKSKGLKEIINASGRMTALGVSTPRAATLEAMALAGQNFVVLHELMNYADQEISKFTGAEASCPTACASAGIAISVAATIAKENLLRIETLPQVLDGFKNEIVLQKGHAVNFGAPIETMIRLGGGKPVLAGQANKVHKEHLIASINERTAALFYVKSHHCVQKGMLSVGAMAEIAHAHNLPLIVDAAAEESLSKYHEAGADMVIYSGSKAIEGPTSGFITGKREWIQACHLQYLGIGRAMKIGKENIMGLLTALADYKEERTAEEIVTMKAWAESLAVKLDALPGFKASVVQDEAGRAIFRTTAKIDAKVVGMTAADLVARMKNADPAIYIREHYVNTGVLTFDLRSVKEVDLVKITEVIIGCLERVNR
jgi:L-seryl-tRNA(Ser) seleniumtransferase/D-glucosaminate-6-phosphate ammonia-lyase